MIINLFVNLWSRTISGPFLSDPFDPILNKANLDQEAGADFIYKLVKLYQHPSSLL